jgi:putative membrane protein
MGIEAFFGDEARARVAEAVQRAEARSRGQIVAAVVEKSDAYPEVRYRGALLGAALATGALLATRLSISPAELVIAQVAAGLLGALLSLWDPLERLLAGPRALDEAVRARAVRAFQEHGLHRTAEGTGVLVFASLFERRAVVLGDHGIHGKVGEGEWDRALSALVGGMKAGDPGQGFLDAVSLCGERLAEHFPRAPSSPAAPNELPDALQVSRT